MEYPEDYCHERFYGINPAKRYVSMGYQGRSPWLVSTNPTGSRGHGNKTLERIAEATGGRSYVPSQITEVANAFAAIQEELRSQYAVSYKPAAFRLDGHYRTIEVQAQNQKGLRIRSRKGYRSPAEYDVPNQ